MEKIIIKYLSGGANEQEKAKILEWVRSDSSNAQFFSSLKHAWSLKSAEELAKEEPVKSVPFSKEYIRENGPATKRLLGVRRGFFIATALSVAALFVLFFSLHLSMKAKIESYKSEITFLLSQTDAQYEYSTPYGVKGRVELPDGSNVWLNSGSKISFPPKFEGEYREISFSGEGYFEVVSNPSKPMQIELNSGHKVNVLGTTFNLSSYNNDSMISLLLIKGEVNVKSPAKGELLKVKPNEKLIIDLPAGKHLKEMPKEFLPTIGWKSGWLVFEETPLEEVFKKMERWYGQKIEVRDPAVLSKRLTAKFHEESAHQVLDLMKQIALIEYYIKDSVAIVSAQ